MILYHVISTYHLLNAMVHKATHKEKATLVMSEWLPEKFSNINELEDFFDNVLVMDANYAFLHKSKDTDTYITSLLGDLDTYETMYIWGSQFTLGYNCAQKNIPFVYCEEASGIYSRPEILSGIEKNNSLKGSFHTEIDQLGLYDGSADCVSKVLCNRVAQVNGFEPSKPILDFNVVKELSALPEKTLLWIQRFFLGDKSVHIEEDSLLILTQHFTNLKITTFEQQALAYQLLVDYFFPGRKLVFKPHPDDLMYYSQLFPEAQIIREKFPSEFIPFVLDQPPAGIATVSSTAIYNLRGCFNEIFELDNRWDTTFEMTHRYYAAIRIAQTLQLPIVCHSSANEVLVQHLCKMLDGSQPEVLLDAVAFTGPCLLLVDDVTEQGESGREEIQSLLQQLDADSCMIFINSKDDYCWYDYDHRDQWDFIGQVVLKKQKLEPVSEDFYASLEDDVIYVYSQNKELLTMAKETEINKELPHTGISLENRTFTPEQEQIKMLEGILAATERRLVYYIEKEREAK